MNSYQFEQVLHVLPHRVRQAPDYRSALIIYIISHGFRPEFGFEPQPDPVEERKCQNELNRLFEYFDLNLHVQSPDRNHLRIISNLDLLASPGMGDQDESKSLMPSSPTAFSVQYVAKLCGVEEEFSLWDYVQPPPFTLDWSRATAFRTILLSLGKLIEIGEVRISELPQQEDVAKSGGMTLIGVIDLL